MNLNICLCCFEKDLLKNNQHIIKDKNKKFKAFVLCNLCYKYIYFYLKKEKNKSFSFKKKSLIGLLKIFNDEMFLNNLFCLENNLILYFGNTLINFLNGLLGFIVSLPHIFSSSQNPNIKKMSLIFQTILKKMNLNSIEKIQILLTNVPFLCRWISLLLDEMNVKLANKNSSYNKLIDFLKEKATENDLFLNPNYILKIIKLLEELPKDANFLSIIQSRSMDILKFINFIKIKFNVDINQYLSIFIQQMFNNFINNNNNNLNDKTLYNKIKKLNIDNNDFKNSQSSKDNEDNDAKMKNEELLYIKNKLEKFFDFNYFKKVISEVQASVKGHDKEIKRITFQIFLNYMYNYIKFFKKDSKMIDYFIRNIIIRGESGIGKTLICKMICQIIDVPYIVVDCSKMTLVGFVGEDADSCIGKLFEKTHSVLKTELLGIIILDEFDKIATNKNSNDKFFINTGGVQANLLKLLEGTEISTVYGRKKAMIVPLAINNNDKKIKTHNIMFIALGVFSNLKINQKKLINFLDNTLDVQDMLNIQNNFKKNNEIEKALDNVGIMSELIGRFSSFIILNKLTKKDMRDILLNSIISPLKPFQIFFKFFGYKFKLSEELINNLSEISLNSKCGVRSLNRNVTFCLNSIYNMIFLNEKSLINVQKINELKEIVIGIKDNKIKIL